LTPQPFLMFFAPTHPMRGTCSKVAAETFTYEKPMAEASAKRHSDKRSNRSGKPLHRSNYVRVLRPLQSTAFGRPHRQSAQNPSKRG
jgi:hypothetical protein